MVDSAGVVVKSYTYDVYGKPTAAGSLANDFDFAGQQTDGTGLQYLRARYMDPETGTFLSREPMSVSPGWLDGGHTYVRGNPANATDATGLCMDGSPECQGTSTAPPSEGSWRFLGWIWSDEPGPLAWSEWYQSGIGYHFRECHLLVKEKTELGRECGAETYMSPEEADQLRAAAAAAAAVSEFWRNLDPFRGKTKTNGKSGKDRRYYEKDYGENEIEVYDRNGKHLGALRPDGSLRPNSRKPDRQIDVN